MKRQRHPRSRCRRFCSFRSLAAFLALVILILGQPLRSETAEAKPTKPELDKFSSKHNGTLTEDDLYLLFLYEQNPALSKKAPPDQLTPEQRAAAIIFARANQDVILKVHDLTSAPTHTFAEVTQIRHFKLPGAAPKPLLPAGFLLRSAYEQLDLGTDPKPGDKAQPANLSYAHNSLTDQDTWTAQGTLMRPFVPFEEKHPLVGAPYLSEIQIVPSVTFDRLTGSGVAITKQTDSLIFRVGSDTEFANVNMFNLLNGLQNIRLNFSHATDFGFRSQVLGGEADWEPTDIGKALGDYKPLFGAGSPFRYRLRLYLHSEAGSIVDPGRKAALATAADQYARIGFFSQVEIQPSNFNRATLVVSYFDYESLMSNSVSAHLFTSGFTLGLDEAGSVSLQIKYRNGRLPITLDKVEDITVGLGLKL